MIGVDARLSYSGHLLSIDPIVPSWCHAIYPGLLVRSFKPLRVKRMLC